MSGSSMSSARLDPGQEAVDVGELALEVSAKETTELSMRLRQLTRMRWIRLSSRSTCRNELAPPATEVLYFAS
jgi:hypothetical protein